MDKTLLRQLARSAGLIESGSEYRSDMADGVSRDDLVRFVGLVAEECAKVAETCRVERFCTPSHVAQQEKQRADTAAAIRAAFPKV